MTHKTFTSAPLPFMGQKRRFSTLFKKALNEFESATNVVGSILYFFCTFQF